MGTGITGALKRARNRWGAHRYERRCAKLTRANLKSVGGIFKRVKAPNRKRYGTPHLIALLFLPYKPGPVPTHPQMATEYRFVTAKTRELQRYCRRGLVLAALALSCIVFVFVLPFPVNFIVWAGASYGIGRVDRWNKSSRSAQLAFIESTYRLGGFGRVSLGLIPSLPT